MRVLIVNTSEKTGGAAVAANRLMDALNNNGVKAKMLVRDKETDDIHLSWINQGMLSLKNIRKIIRSGKPVVWTMHDLWPAAGICPIKAARTTSQQRYSAARRNSTIAAPSPSSPVAVGSNGRLRAAVSS